MEGVRDLLNGHYAEGSRRELEVEDLWPHKDLLVVKFRGVDRFPRLSL